MSSPTVGRIVHFYEGDAQPLAAIVTRVWSPDSVNLCVFTASGTPVARNSIPRRGAWPNQTASWAWPERGGK